MNITILTLGSRGDVQPYVALGAGLRAAGHRVTLATHACFESFTREYGLHFSPVAGDPRDCSRAKPDRCGWRATAIPCVSCGA